MRGQFHHGLLIFGAALASASPLAAPEISPFPILVPISPVDIASDTTGVRTVSAARMADSAVTLARRDTTTTFPDLVPSTTVDLATDSTYSSQDVSPVRVPSSTVVITSAATTPAVSVVAAAETTDPDRSPTATVDLSTDTAGTRTTSPAREATSTGLLTSLIAPTPSAIVTSTAGQSQQSSTSTEKQSAAVKAFSLHAGTSLLTMGIASSVFAMVLLVA